MAFARRTYDKRHNVNVPRKIIASHDDDLEKTLSGFNLHGPKNGQVPIYIYASPDDEAFLFSSHPINSDRIREEFGDDIIGLEYADQGDDPE